jgi:hypothetical protein
MINSDETDNNPEYIFSSTEHFGNSSTKMWDPDNGAIRELFKLKIFPDELIFNPGDMFMIAFQADITGNGYEVDESNVYVKLKQILSLYGLYNPDF